MMKVYVYTEMINYFEENAEPAILSVRVFSDIEKAKSHLNMRFDEEVAQLLPPEIEVFDENDYIKFFSANEFEMFMEIVERDIE